MEIYFLTRETGSVGSNVAGMLKCPGLIPAGEMTSYSVGLGEAVAKANWNPEKDLLRIDLEISPIPRSLSGISTSVDATG